MLPKVQRPAQDAELADMIRIVPGDDENLAQDRVPRLGMRDLRCQVARRIFDDGDQLRAIGEEGVDRALPYGGIRQRVGRGPVINRVIQVLVMRILDVVEDVGLGDAQVLKQMPEE